MNRFYDLEGDRCLQLAPWAVQERGLAQHKAWYVLLDDIRFRSDIAGDDIVAPAGMVTDFASIPQQVWSIFMDPDDPRIALGSIIHDYLYSMNGILPAPLGTLTREDADRILAFEAMPDCGATLLEQNATFWSLRAFGDRW